jgi:integrase
MINRENYFDVYAWLNYLQERQVDSMTIKTYWSRIRHLLEWANDCRLTEIYKIKPTFPAFIENLKNRQGGALGAAQFTALCKTARAFLSWARDEYPPRYRKVEKHWIDTIVPPRGRGEESELRERVIYQVEEVIKLATCPVEYLTEKRTRAGAAFLFLSGMRIGAFSTLPIGCVDLEHLKVEQLPSRGVRTKNRKAAITTLLPIPELLQVVREWDNQVRGSLGSECLWYAHMDHHGELTQEQPDQKALTERTHLFNKDLKKLCEKAGIAYKSAHKFRHGHAVYALKRAKTVEQLKAISQNLMHSTVGITDGIYGNLVEDDVHNTIMGLTAGSENERSRISPELEKLIRQFVAQQAGKNTPGSQPERV